MLLLKQPHDQLDELSIVSGAAQGSINSTLKTTKTDISSVKVDFLLKIALIFVSHLSWCRKAQSLFFFSRIDMQ